MLFMSVISTWFLPRSLGYKNIFFLKSIAETRVLLLIPFLLIVDVLLLVWPWLNWQYPVLFGIEFPRFIAACFVLGIIYIGAIWGRKDFDHARGFQVFWMQFWHWHERALLFLLPEKNHNYYSWHIRWRFVLLGRKTKRFWQRGSIWRWFKHQRWLWVILASLLTVGMLWALANALNINDTRFSTRLLSHDSPTGLWTLITALISAPIAFVIWLYRDQNNLWQIENQRKDINLKDFQKLAEWASGQHLVESKVTETINENKTEVQHTRESSRSVEYSLPSTSKVLPTPSRRKGSASLQIAAVYQLQAFLRGDFGHHFQQPAFVLLKSIWLSLMQQHVDAWQDSFYDVLAKHNQVGNEKDTPLDTWLQQLQDTARTPLAQALTQALASERGARLRVHIDQLPNLCMAGLDSMQPGLQPLELDGLAMHGINWQGATLDAVQLQETSLRDARLQGATFGWPQLQGADLTTAQMQGTTLMVAQLQGAVLDEVKLHGATLYEPQLQGAFFRDAQLQGAMFINPDVNAETNFKNATTDSNTQILVSLKTESEIDGTEINHVATHALRIRLRDKNYLILPESAYTEYLADYNAAQSHAPNPPAHVA